MKTNIEALALAAINFCGLTEARAPGLAVLFAMVEREAFCDGVRLGREASFATDPAIMHERYSAGASMPSDPPASPDAVPVSEGDARG